jgi:hypothetical protein
MAGGVGVGCWQRARVSSSDTEAGPGGDGELTGHRAGLPLLPGLHNMLDLEHLALMDGMPF